ncbi:MAG: response regulator [Bacteroidaceae bacterium]|nr:response regulator [Bacteroidaceae bacterium]
MIQARVLIIDDNVAVLQSLRLVLKDSFSKVAAVSDPQLIPAIIREGNVDVVLLDMNFGKGKMDGADGIFWLNRIKRYSCLENPPSVVLITAFSGIDLAVNCMKQGADDFIQKPWDNAQLVQKVAEAVKKHREATLRQKSVSEEKEENRVQVNVGAKEEPTEKSLNTTSSLAEMEREHIREVIREHNGNIKAAAKALGISRSTLYSKMKRYGLV